MLTYTTHAGDSLNVECFICAYWFELLRKLFLHVTDRATEHLINDTCIARCSSWALYGLSYLTTGTNEIEKMSSHFCSCCCRMVSYQWTWRRYAGASEEQAINSHKWSTNGILFSDNPICGFFYRSGFEFDTSDGTAYIKEVEIDRVGFRIVQTRNCASWHTGNV